MKQKYICENCDGEFDSTYECNEHEKVCKIEINKLCNKCGKVDKWIENDDNYYSYYKSEEWHYISLGQMGYGSCLDGCDVNFTICDTCLRSFIDSFTFEGQEKVINSGSNTHMSPEDWIKEAKGEFTDEDYESNNMYSPRQIKAYEERFPICNKVERWIYKDDSSGCHCIRGAYGNEDGSCGSNYSDECYECSKFEVRKDDEVIPIVYKDSRMFD